MTDARFDDLAKMLGSTTSRRTLMKRLGAVALGLGALAAVSNVAGAQTQACSRIQQACDAETHCCAGYVCDAEAGVCRVAVGQTCYKPADCVTGATCAPNPHGLGAVCVTA